MPLLMLKPENLKNIVNSPKENIKFFGNKDAPKKFHASHKEAKIATTKEPTQSTSFNTSSSTIYLPNASYLITTSY